MNQKIKILTVMMLCMAVLVGCKDKGNAAADKPGAAGQKKDEQSVFAVDVIKVVRGEFNDYIKLYGNIQSKRNVKVFPDQNGKVANLYVKLGQTVSKGTKLMDIDPSKPGMTYANSPVFAPVAGSVTSLPFKIGETVSVQSAVASIGQLDSLEVVSNVAEKYISKMKEGLQVYIDVDAYHDMTFKGVTSEISPVVDEISRTLEVKADVRDPNSKLLKPGMYGNMRVITEYKPNAFKIPSECVMRRYGDTFVYVIAQIPTMITNKDLDKLLQGATMEQQQILLKYFPRMLPAELRTDIFEYNILKALDGKPEDQEILKAIYTYDKDKEMYVTQNKSFGAKEQRAWDIFIAQDRTYNLSTPQKVRLDKTQDLDLRELLLEKEFIDKDTLFAEKRMVGAGIEIDNKVEITKGLKQDEQIVYSGQTLLEDNARVKIVQTLNILTKEDSLK
ncbi:MAG: efflux RND transporter periplasmic adaptor subunit [Spirochaetales bacterium]|nr:efflux RND transporter periplasmic adaptor subunit [Spirochaetales bacterium]